MFSLSVLKTYEFSLQQENYVLEIVFTFSVAEIVRSNQIQILPQIAFLSKSKSDFEYFLCKKKVKN